MPDATQRGLDRGPLLVGGGASASAVALAACGSSSSSAAGLPKGQFRIRSVVDGNAHLSRNTYSAQQAADKLVVLLAASVAGHREAAHDAPNRADKLARADAARAWEKHLNRAVED